MNGKRPGGWVALATRYYRDPKFLTAGPDAELLWGHALAFTVEQSTDGHVPLGALGLLASNLNGCPMAAAEALVTAGLWRERPDGWAFPDNWAAWQETAEQRADQRTRKAERQARLRDSRRSTDASRDGPRDASRDGASGAGAGAGHSPLPPGPPTVLGVQIWESGGHLWAAPAPEAREGD